jgi:hypothetical protein
MSKPLAMLLRDEFLFFYSTRAKQSRNPLNMFTSVDMKGMQTILVLSNIPDGAGYDLNFLRTVLQKEASVGYALAHWTVQMTSEESGGTESTETINIYTADSRMNYCWTEIGPPDGKKWGPGLQTINNRVTRKPEIFFQELLRPTPAWQPTEKALKVWDQVNQSEKVIRRARQDLVLPAAPAETVKAPSSAG